MNMDALLLQNFDAGVLTLTFNRPKKKNAFTPELYDLISDALDAASANATVRVVVMTGAGNAYTSGNDVADFMNTPPAGTDSPVFRLLKTLVDFDKPLIAAVNGAAVGIGVTMLLHCDFVYMSDAARLKLPFVNLGLVPEAGASILLPALAGVLRANELLMGGEEFSPVMAKEMGLANAIFPADQLLATVAEKAKTLAEKPLSSLKLTKKLIRDPQRPAIHAALLREGEIFLEQLSSPEAVEAFTAFFEKRKPDFLQFS